MLDIKIDGHSADLYPDTSLDLSIQNTHLLPNEITTSHAAYLPTLPVTPLNSKLLRHFEVFQAQVSQERHRVDAYYAGQLLSSGSFVITEAGADGYSGGIVENISEIFGQYSDKLLPDLPFPLYTIPTNRSLSVSEVTFPVINNSNFYGSAPPPGYTGKMNNYVSGAYTGVSPCVPCFRVSFILQQIATLTGVSITVDTPYLDNLIFVSLKEETPGTPFRIGPHLPVCTIGKLLTELKKVLYLKVIPDLRTRSIHISSMQGAFYQTSPVNWSDKVALGEIKTPETTPGLSVSFKVDSSDVYLKDHPDIFSTVSTDQNSTQIDLQFCSVARDLVSGLGIIQQEGVTTVNSQQDKKFEPRLAYFHPIGSLSGVTVPTAHLQGLATLSPLGILQLYQEYINIRANAFYVKSQMNLTPHDLSHPLTRRIHINGLNFLLVSVNAQLPLRGLTECVFIKI